MKLSPEACVQVASVVMGGSMAICGAASAGAIPAGIGAVALGALWLNHKSKAGADNVSAYKTIIKIAKQDWAKNYQDLGAKFDIDAASKLLVKALPDIRLTPKEVAATTVEPGGFPEAATTLIYGKLTNWCAEQEPPERLFETSQAAEPFIKSIFRSVFAAAIDDKAYFEQFEPHILIELARMTQEISDELLAVQDILTDIKDDIERLPEETARAVVDEWERRGYASSTLKPKTIMAAARRLPEAGNDLDGLVIGLISALDAAESLAALGHSQHNAEAFIDLAFQRAAELSADGEFDKADDELAAALVRMDAEDAEREERRTQQRVDLWSARVKANLAASNVNAVAEAEWQKIKLTYAETEWIGALLAVEDYYREKGVRMGGQLDLRISLALCEIGLSMVLNKTDRPNHLNRKAAALRVLGERIAGEKGLQSLSDAIMLYNAALKAITKDNAATQWAATQQNKAVALKVYGKRLGGEAGLLKLSEAVDCYDEVLTVITQDDAPDLWATTLQNKAVALKVQGTFIEGEAGFAKLSEAIECYDVLLTSVYTENKAPAKWAATIDNKANALRAQGEHLGGEAAFAKLSEAVICQDAALTVRTKNTAPAEWATTKENVAILFVTRFRLSKDPIDLEKAETAAQDAMSIYSLGDMEFYEQKCQTLLDKIVALKAASPSPSDPTPA